MKRKSTCVERDTHETMVLKTKPNRPVQPGTKHQSNPVIIKNRKLRKKYKKTENHPLNQQNQKLVRLNWF